MSYKLPIAEANRRRIPEGLRNSFMGKVLGIQDPQFYHPQWLLDREAARKATASHADETRRAEVQQRANDYRVYARSITDHLRDQGVPFANHVVVHDRSVLPGGDIETEVAVWEVTAARNKRRSAAASHLPPAAPGLALTANGDYLTTKHDNSAQFMNDEAVAGLYPNAKACFAELGRFSAELQNTADRQSRSGQLNPDLLARLDDYRASHP